MMKQSERKNSYRKYYFIENYLIALILLFFIITTLISHFFTAFKLFDAVDYFVEHTLASALATLKNSLLSVAAIFIGIYVTVFTLLGSIKVDSIFAFLNERTFKKLITFIRNAFIASFGYLILVICTELVYDKFESMGYALIVINASIVMYMFLTAFRFGVILYLAFNKDLKDLTNNIQKQRNEILELQKLKSRIEKFLDTFEDIQDKKKAQEMSKIINSKENHNETKKPK